MMTRSVRALMYAMVCGVCTALPAALAQQDHPAAAATPPAPQANPQPDSQPTAQPDSQRFDNAMQKRYRGQYWGSVLVARDGKVIFAKGYGIANKTLSPMTADSLFDIASVTKQFTAAAILHLEMDKKLSIEDPAAMYIADVPRANQDITIYHLLTHTSGLDQAQMQFPEHDSGEVFAQAIMAAPRKHKPGEVHEYSNPGYFALAAIIEKASGQKYEDYMRDHIFAPAKMTSTTIMGKRPADPALITDRIDPQGRTVGNALKWPYPVVWGYQGAGGVVSSVSDMFRWDQALRGETILDAKTKETYFKAFKSNYACGWECKESSLGHIVEHSGGVLGYATWFTRYLDQDACIIVLSNGSNDPHETMKLLRDELFPQFASVLRSAHFNTGSYKLTEFHAAELKGPITTVVQRRGADVAVMLMDGDRVKPAAEFIVSLGMAQEMLAQLSDALLGQQREGNQHPTEGGLYISPYAPLASGDVEFGAGDLVLDVVPMVLESSEDGKSVKDDRITLRAMDSVNVFSPVMVKFSSGDAKKFQEQLATAVSGAK